MNDITEKILREVSSHSTHVLSKKTTLLKGILLRKFYSRNIYLLRRFVSMDILSEITDQSQQHIPKE